MNWLKNLLRQWLGAPNLVGGNTIASIDYDQAELRLIVTPADNGKIIEIFLPEDRTVGKNAPVKRTRFRRLVGTDDDIMDQIKVAIVTARLS